MRQIMVLILMGVSGAGKTTIGRALASQLGWSFVDGDDLHSDANKRKMAHGIALIDADRRPWLERVRAVIERSLKSGADLVIACSALKQSYRDRIVVDPAKVAVVYLKADAEVISDRIAHRTGHFMSKDLLQSQFDTLEEPRGAIVVDVSGTPAEIVSAIRRRLNI